MQSTSPPMDHRQDYLWLLMLLGGSSIALYVVAYALLGMGVLAIVEAAFLAEVLAILAWMRWGRPRFQSVVLLEIVLVMAVVAANTVLMGGLDESGGFAVWTYLCPMAAILFLEGAIQRLILVSSLLFMVVLALAEPYMVAVNPLPEALRGTFLALNATASAVVCLGTILFFHVRLQREQGMVRDSEERYRATLDRVPSAVSLKDVDGRYLLVNQGFLDLFGVSTSDVLGRRDREVFPEDVSASIETGDRMARDRDELAEVEEALRVGGGIRDVASIRFPVHFGDRREPALCWIASDVTLRNRLQEDILKTRKLESLGTLAGGIAHDFNNLLMAALGNLGLLRIQVPAGAWTSRLDHAEEALRRAGGLTRQLLAFSRGGAPVRSAVELGSTIRESATLALSGTNVRCEFRLPDRLPFVDADPGQIGQMVQNLVQNAVQAMPGGGTVCVSAEPCVGDGSALGLPKGRCGVRLDVRDEGGGIPEAIRERIFDPYFTTHPGRSGLGLATCHAIVRSHEGTLRMESEVGRGTTFTVVLPASEEVPAPAPPPVPSRDGKVRVLVMDDEAPVRDVMRGMLESLGYEVETVSDGDAAIRRFGQARDDGRPFDVVVLDLTVRGGLGGVGAVRGILELDPRARAVAASGYTDDPILAEHRARGFRGVLRKPFSMGELDEVVTAARSEAG